jgi:RNA polymerase sigma-70 factor, ECF subfamily
MGEHPNRLFRNGSTGRANQRTAPSEKAAAKPVERPPQAPAKDEVPVDDFTIVRHVLEGNKDDFAVLVGRYNNRLHRFVVSKSADETAADDIVQKSFLTAYELLNSYDPRWPFFEWLRGIARNHCRNEWRQYLRRARLTDQLLEVKRAEWEIAAVAHEGAPGDDRLDALRTCMASLNEFDRRLITQRFVDRLSLKAIGERLGRTDAAMAQILYGLRMRLATCVRRRLGLEERGAT